MKPCLYSIEELETIKWIYQIEINQKYHQIFHDNQDIVINFIYKNGWSKWSWYQTRLQHALNSRYHTNLSKFIENERKFLFKKVLFSVTVLQE